MGGEGSGSTSKRRCHTRILPWRPSTTPPSRRSPRGCQDSPSSWIDWVGHHKRCSARSLTASGRPAQAMAQSRARRTRALRRQGQAWWRPAAIATLMAPQGTRLRPFNPTPTRAQRTLGPWSLWPGSTPASLAMAPPGPGKYTSLGHLMRTGRPRSSNSKANPTATARPTAAAPRGSGCQGRAALSQTPPGGELQLLPR